jgi:hypothetical protein
MTIDKVTWTLQGKSAIVPWLSERVSAQAQGGRAT